MASTGHGEGYGIKAENPYSFDRWAMAADGQPVVATAPVPSRDQAQGFADFDDLRSSGLNASNFIANDHNTSDQPLDASGLGFFGGVDASTALFYSAGAALGVIGANLKVIPMPNRSMVARLSWKTPPILSPMNSKSQYGLGRIKAQYAYARGHTGSGGFGVGHG